MRAIAKIPDKIEVRLNGFKVSVKGPKGEIEKDFSSPLFNKTIKMVQNAGIVEVSSSNDKRKTKSQVGNVAAQIRNMVNGVTEGYTYKLKVVYLHFPFTVKVAGKEVQLGNFLGEKAPRTAEIIGNTKVEVKGDEIIVTGINKEETGQTAANLERSARIKARDRRVYQDGIFIVERPK